MFRFFNILLNMIIALMKFDDMNSNNETNSKNYKPLSWTFGGMLYHIIDAGIDFSQLGHSLLQLVAQVFMCLVKCWYSIDFPHTGQMDCRLQLILAIVEMVTYPAMKLFKFKSRNFIVK